MGEKTGWTVRGKVPRAATFAATVLAAILAIAIFCVSSIHGSNLPRNISPFTTIAHFCEYAVLGALIAISSRAWTSTDSMSAIAAIAISSAYGISDEIHQLFVPGRTCDVFDWLADTAGAAVGAAAAILVMRRIDARG